MLIILLSTPYRNVLTEMKDPLISCFGLLTLFTPKGKCREKHRLQVTIHEVFQNVWILPAHFRDNTVHFSDLWIINYCLVYFDVNIKVLIQMLLVLQTTWTYAVIRLHCLVSRISSSTAAVQCHTHVALEILPFLFLREKKWGCPTFHEQNTEFSAM